MCVNFLFRFGKVFGFVDLRIYFVCFSGLRQTCTFKSWCLLFTFSYMNWIYKQIPKQQVTCLLLETFYLGCVFSLATKTEVFANT